jgi:multidrug efflux pump subunit AcrA (membrane-fusion protein)
MTTRILLPIASLLMLGFAVYHVVNAQQAPPKLPPPNQPNRAPFRETIAGGGVVEARSENIAVGSNLAGVVAEVFVRVGDPVKGPAGSFKGTPLFRLDDRALQAEYAAREANVEAFRATLDRLERLPRKEEVPPLEARVRESEATLHDARDQYLRAQQLVKTRAVGDEEVIRRRNAVTAAEAQLAKAEAELTLLNRGSWEPEKEIARRNLAMAQAQANQTMTEIDRLTVHAPIDGQVLQNNVRVGESVDSRPGQSLIWIGDLSVLHVRVDIDENDLPRFQPGYKGRALRRGESKDDIPLEFVRVEPLVVPKRSLTGAGTERVDTRVLPVIYAVKNSAAKLYVGQQVDVFLDVEKP